MKLKTAIAVMLLVGLAALASKRPINHAGAPMPKQSATRQVVPQKPNAGPILPCPPAPCVAEDDKKPTDQKTT